MIGQEKFSYEANSQKKDKSVSFWTEGILLKNLKKIFTNSQCYFGFQKIPK